MGPCISLVCQNVALCGNLLNTIQSIKSVSFSDQHSFDGGVRDRIEMAFEVDHLATYTSKSGKFDFGGGGGGGACA